MSSEFRFAPEKDRFAGMGGSASTEDTSGFRFFEQSNPTGLTGGTVKAYEEPAPTGPFAALSSPEPSALRFEASASKADVGDVVDGFRFAPGSIKKASPVVHWDPFSSSESSDVELSQAFKKFVRSYDPDDEDETPPLRKREKFTPGMNVVVLSDKRRRMRITKAIPMPRNFFLIYGDWTDGNGSVRGFFSGAELAIAA